MRKTIKVDDVVKMGRRCVSYSKDAYRQNKPDVARSFECEADAMVSLLVNCLIDVSPVEDATKWNKEWEYIHSLIFD